MADYLTRRCFIAAAVAAPAIVPSMAKADSELLPITPEEYLAVMEAHGWLPRTANFAGRPGGVYEHFDGGVPTEEDRQFLHLITRRIGKSMGPDAYREQIAPYLFAQGRIDEDFTFSRDARGKLRRVA